jgi:hypothetical protein
MWSDILSEWENGIPMKYPTHLNRFQWNTSVLKNNGNIPFNQYFKEDINLAKTQNYTPFQEYINNSQNKYVTAFPNLNKDSMLVIPMPRRGKNYATLKDFIDNATKIQQREFWKKVAEVAKKFMKQNGEAWISVHGLGVDYTHVRIDSKPKYYFKLKN